MVYNESLERSTRAILLVPLPFASGRSAATFMWNFPNAPHSLDQKPGAPVLAVDPCSHTCLGLGLNIPPCIRPRFLPARPWVFNKSSRPRSLGINLHQALHANTMPPSKRASASSPEETPLPKKRQMTESQLNRKRELDRAAQQNSRARTKNHIDYLETLVKSLRADADDRVSDLLHQLDKKQKEIQRLRRILNNIGKQLALAEKEAPVEDSDSEGGASDQNNDDQLPSPTSPVLQPELSSSAVEQSTQDVAVDEPAFPANSISISPVEHPEPRAVLAPTSTSTGCQSIAQLASSIVNTPNLEGRYWYLAGVILNNILSAPTSAPITTALDEDIAIRAVFHGWTSVIERYSLDRGWQWLKELDERIYFHLSAPLRLSHLRNCRLILLKQLFPDDGWGALAPPCFAPRPSQENAGYDPMVDHFPWPGFRDKLLLSPLKFATNKFMTALQRYVDFTWERDLHEIYVKDPMTDLYHLSDLAQARLKDVRCYTVSQDFFVEFPELRADIPCTSVLPRSIRPRKKYPQAVEELFLPFETNGCTVDRARSPLSAAINQVLELMI